MEFTATTLITGRRGYGTTASTYSVNFFRSNVNNY